MKGVSLCLWIRRTPIIPLLLTVCLELAASFIVKRDNTPYFEPTPSNITVHEGELAVLKCHIGNLGPKMVVWRKIGQDVPLTIGEMRFAPEATELTVAHLRTSSTSSTWNLLIKNVQSSHAGIYECQVTANHRIAQNVILNVLEPSKMRPELKMGGTQYVDIGSQIHLTCNSSGDGRTPGAVDWFFEGNRVHPSNPKWRGRLEILRRTSFDEKFYISELIIDRSTMEDNGSYVCRSSDLMVSSLKVHVLRDGLKDNPLKRGTGKGDGEEYKSDEIRKPSSTARRTSSIPLLQILTILIFVRLTS